MASATFTYVTLALIFAALFLGVAKTLLSGRRSPMLWVYALVTLVFLYLLPVQEYSEGVEVETLLLSHLLMIGYLATVLFVARRTAADLNSVVAAAMSVSVRVALLVIASWIAIRAYLFAAYGPAALMFSRSQVVQSSGLVEFASWEVALSSISTLMLMGLFAVAVIRHAANQPWRSMWLNLVIVIMILITLVTNESPIGSRRLLLVLSALWLAVTWAGSGLPAWKWIEQRAGRLLIVAAVVAGAGIYYQFVRNNDFTAILRAEGLFEYVGAIAKFATTFDSHSSDEDVQMLRSGPFDFFAKVVDVAMVTGRSSNGEATSSSLTIAVPKALYPGEKPVGDVDEVLLDRLHIYPSRPFLSIDYPTSLPAIGVADFGLAGVILAACCLGACFLLVGYALRRFKAIPLQALVAFGVAINLMGSQEAGLTAVVVTIRDAFLVVFVLAIGRWNAIAWRRIAMVSVRRTTRQLGVSTSVGPRTAL